MVNNFEDIFIRFGATHERDRRTDGQTDGQTPHMPAIAALCIASHCKNQQTDLVLQALLNGQPVQSISDVAGDVVVLPFVQYQSTRCVQHVL